MTTETEKAAPCEVCGRKRGTMHEQCYSSASKMGYVECYVIGYERERAGRIKAEQERDALRTELLGLRQQVEDTIMVAKTDSEDGFITAYHFKTGAIHRLLGRVRFTVEEVAAAIAAGRADANSLKKPSAP